MECAEVFDVAIAAAVRVSGGVAVKVQGLCHICPCEVVVHMKGSSDLRCYSVASCVASAECLRCLPVLRAASEMKLLRG